MGFLGKRFKRRRRPTPSPVELLLTLIAFIYAETPNNARRILEAHPELLSDEADALLGRMAKAMENGDARRIVEQFRALLLRSREVGIEQAFAELTKPVPEELLQVIVAFIQAGTPDNARRILEAHPELLSDEADALLGQLATAQENEDARRTVEWHSTFLRRCREVGIEQAFAELTDPAIPPQFQGDFHRAKEYQTRYLQTGDLKVLDEAIAAWEQILHHSAFPQTEARFRLTVLNDAGTTYMERYKAQGQMFDLKRAIYLFEETICLWEKASEIFDALTPSDLRNYASSLNNLGIALRKLYERTKNLDHLNAAVRLICKSINFTPPDSLDLLARITNLGNTLHARYVHTGNEDDLRHAFFLQHAAKDHTPNDSPKWVSRLTNFIISLLSLSRLKENDADLDKTLDETISQLEDALQKLPANHPDRPAILNNLGTGLRERYARTKRYARTRKKDLNDAVTFFREACQLGLKIAPEVAMGAARTWAQWAFERRAWTEVEEAVNCALKVMDRLVMVQITREAKESWLREFQGLPALGAYALAKQGKLRQAVETVEHGRAQLLREALERNRRDLARLEALGHGDLLDRYRRALETHKARLASLRQAAEGKVPGLTLQEARQALREADAALEAVIAEIRRVPGYERFLLPPAFADIQAAAQEAPLIYLLATPAGGLALIVAGKGSSRPPVTPVWMESLTEEALQEHVRRYLDAYRPWSDYLRKRETPPPAITDAWFQALDEATRWLGEVLTPPLTPPLRGGGSGEGVLIPSGLLGLLPLHAAWREVEGRRRYAMDDIAFTYAPSARALLEARQIARATQGKHLFAVDNPDGSLRYSRQEVEAVAAHFPQPFIAKGEKATLATVLHALPRYDLYHFSCHGATHWGDPMESALKLYGRGRFTVREALEMEGLQARLAFLSACETGILGRELPDEVVALPVGLQQAGVAGVVSTLWSVNEVSTAKLVEKFYALWKGEGLPPAVALNAAQRWLRDEADGGRWSHPFYWAAFTLTGV